MTKELHEYTVRLAAPESEFSPEFIRGMANRMAVAYYGKGPVADAYPHKFDALASAMDRVQKYMDDGNTEYLIDAANFLLIEFMHPRHPQAHFRATDSDGSIGRVTNDGRVVHDKNDQVYRTQTGKIMTNSDIQDLANEAELGYDTERLFQPRDKR